MLFLIGTALLINFNFMRIITFLTLLFPLLIFSQRSFSVEYEADYKLSYKIKNTPNAPQSEAAFALLINKTSSC